MKYPNVLMAMSLVCAFEVADLGAASAHSSSHHSSIHVGDNGRSSRHASPGEDRSNSSGLASVYSGGGTASGEHMNSGAMTAAHRTLPFGTRVTVTNGHTGSSVVVRINDRGPFVRGRVIDLSPAAARAIGVSGVPPVSLSVGE
jgi:rare lipoprotein A